jgi:hypothetical protein
MAMKRTLLVGFLALLSGGLACAAEAADSAKTAKSPAALKAAIDSLKVPRVAWRDIAWKSCLLEGLAESRTKNKPILLWVFIDRPTDDARC